MTRITFFCKSRDPEDLWLPILRGMFSDLEERPVEGDPVLRGYHEIVTPHEMDVNPAKAAVAALTTLHAVLSFEDQEHVSGDEAKALRAHFKGNLSFL